MSKQVMYFTEYPLNNGWIKARKQSALHLFPAFDFCCSEGSNEDPEQYLHLCSAECALKIVSKFLTETKEKTR